MPVIGGIFLLITVLTVIDIVNANEYEIRGLPKIVWVLLAIFAPIVGACAWFIAGRPDSVQWGGGRSLSSQHRSGFSEYDRPGRQTPVDPEADAEFLRKCRERAEEQRRKLRDYKPKDPRDDE